MTRVECDVGRKMVLNKEVLVKGNRGWARSGLEALASPIQPWYARNTIGISMVNRKVGRKASIELYVSAMNYTTSHRDMTFKEKGIMLRSVSGWNRA